ncbi:DUF6194 family protein [Lachnotalea glycerini]|uniref:DUF6194 domain-containing protein n=1 Tax=Lachnotalea glycerini TaxID=1763509 RepID=A0A371JJZ5_9FIRM|nr:DUF6194 family protein [Lachnotalea glycerini]RDY33030.1 hypothetical protein CG710_000415 [Lachnotalea glycerini]
MNDQEIINYCLENLEGTVLVESWGERGIFYDFTELDKILPHPVYAWMGWICILNPSKDSFEELKPFLQEAYSYAKEKYSKKKLVKS